MCISGGLHCTLDIHIQRSLYFSIELETVAQGNEMEKLYKHAVYNNYLENWCIGKGN